VSEAIGLLLECHLELRVVTLDLLAGPRKALSINRWGQTDSFLAKRSTAQTTPGRKGLVTVWRSLVGTVYQCNACFVALLLRRGCVGMRHITTMQGHKHTLTPTLIYRLIQRVKWYPIMYTWKPIQVLYSGPLYCRSSSSTYGQDTIVEDLPSKVTHVHMETKQNY
jgi:hypothetical protein